MDITETDNLSEIISICEKYRSEPNSIILLDIDDTIITPLSSTFRADPFRQIISDIKSSDLPNKDKIVSSWRLQRKIVLVDPNWSQEIERLKEHFIVHGFTAIDTGKFGFIDSMEKWRAQELRDFGITFTKGDYPLEGESSFSEGIIFTGKECSKALALERYHKISNFNFVIVVDDKTENLKELCEICQKLEITLVPILFQGFKNIEGEPSQNILDIQKAWLTSRFTWLEDKDALNMANTYKNNTIR